MTVVPYSSSPALKIGKLAVNKELSDIVKRERLWFFHVRIGKVVFVFDMNKMGVACRFSNGRCRYRI